MNLPQRQDAAAPAVAGWAGKLPARGDFVSRRVPPSFLDPWERWLSGVLAGSRERLRERWNAAFLQAPLWRFVLGRGVLGAGAWAGLLMPSVDSVGRYYPLTVVCVLPARPLDPGATLERAAGWFEALEPIALGALAPGADLEAFDAALAGAEFPAEALVAAQAAGAARSAWLAEESEIFSRRLLLCDGLPSAAQYAEMLTGEAVAHDAGSP